MKYSESMFQGPCYQQPQALCSRAHTGFRPVALCRRREEEEEEGRRRMRRRMRSLTSDYSHFCFLAGVITLCWTLWSSLYSNNEVSSWWMSIIIWTFDASCQGVHQKKLCKLLQRAQRPFVPHFLYWSLKSFQPFGSPLEEMEKHTNTVLLMVMGEHLCLQSPKSYQ